MNVIWLLVAGICAISRMEQTTQTIDDVDPTDPFHLDTAFGFWELFSLMMEIVACLYCACKVHQSFYVKMVAPCRLRSFGW
jgi:hypothetical protein